MKRVIAVLLFLMCGCASARPVPRSEEVRAVILSDLHFTVRRKDVNTLVPLVSYSEEVLETIIRQVSDLHPDVLIMTGDNTNSGAPEDEKLLADQLRRLKDAGIGIIMTTGNHDFNLSAPEVYEGYFFPLFDIKSRDEASLSWSAKYGNTVFLAMDDETASPGSGGAFSAATMKWLEKELGEAEKDGSIVVFLSHHSVIGEYGPSYTIANKELYPLLKKYDVRPLFTGHQHSLSLLKKEKMTELISAMPMSGAHLMGMITVSDASLSYEQLPVDFRTYAPEGFADIVEASDLAAGESQRSLFADLFANAGMDGTEAQACTELVMTFFSAHAQGTLASQASAITSSPYYGRMLEGLSGSNYGPWIREVMKHPADARSFRIDYTE